MKIIYRCSEHEVTKNFRPPGTLPDWLDKRKCFKSLIDSIKISKLDVPIHVVHDGPEGQLSEYIKNFNIEFEKIYFRSNEISLKHCLNIGKRFNEDVYFLEDDYLHLPNAIIILNEGIQKFGLVSGFDHPDRYTRTDDITYKQEEIQITTSSHWRTAEATTGTWAASKNILNEIVDYAINFGVEDRNFFRHIYRSKGIRLWQTIPGCTTHITNQYKSPLINWEQFNETIVL